MRRSWMNTGFLALALLMVLSAYAHPFTVPQIRAGAFGIRMEPEGTDAQKFSKASWGGGGYVIIVPPNAADLIAGIAGIDIVNMLSQTTEFRDRLTQLRVEQQTSQNFFRFYLGARFGHQGHGFFRPYAGANIAVHYYHISTDVVIPDDRDYENEIRQNLKSEGNAAFGFDGSLGTELNFNDVFYVDLGGRYVKSFSVPQQLGADSETIHPEYVEIYLGFNVKIR